MTCGVNLLNCFDISWYGISDGTSDFLDVLINLLVFNGHFKENGLGRLTLELHKLEINRRSELLLLSLEMTSRVSHLICFDIFWNRFSIGISDVPDALINLLVSIGPVS
jgi:hypothetical protein